MEFKCGTGHVGSVTSKNVNISTLAPTLPQNTTQCFPDHALFSHGVAAPDTVHPPSTICKHRVGLHAFTSPLAPASNATFESIMKPCHQGEVCSGDIAASFVHYPYTPNLTPYPPQIAESNIPPPRLSDWLCYFRVVLIGGKSPDDPFLPPPCVGFLLAICHCCLTRRSDWRKTSMAPCYPRPLLRRVCLCASFPRPVFTTFGTHCRLSR